MQGTYTCVLNFICMDAFTNFYDQMHGKEVMIAYKGEVTSALVQALLNNVEPRLKSIESNVRIRKKVYNILVECLQNIIHHQEFKRPFSSNDQVTLLLVTQESYGYCLRAGNMIANENIQKLKQWLDMVNTFPTSELRELYKIILNDGRFSEKGTAGLGFVDIARKSGQKLQYAFQELNDRFSIFSFHITVPYSIPVN
jgi:hypothetical protein